MANQEFKIQIPITRAYKNESGEMLFEGIASSTSVDSHETVFNEECQNGFMVDILDGINRGEPVELESEHNGDQEPMNVLGPIISAEVIENNKLKIVARLDSDNPKAVYYYNKMTKKDPITGKTKQFGLSINGNVERAHYEHNSELNKSIRVFDRVILKRVGIVRKPSNPDSWIEKLLRSVEWENVEIKERSEKQMSENTENKDEVIDGTEVRNDDEVTTTPEPAPAEEAAVEPVVESPAVVEDQEPKEEAAEEVEVESKDEVAAEGDAEAVEKSGDTNEVGEETEQINRADWWVSKGLLSSMGSLVDAICELEVMAKFDGECLDSGMTEETIRVGKDCLNKLQAVLSNHMSMASDTERALDAANSVASQKEDLSDEVTVVTPVEEKREETPAEVVEEEVAERFEVGIKANVELTKEISVDDVMRAVTSYLNEDFANTLMEKFNKVVDEKFGELNQANEDLKRSIDEVKTENTELVERLAKVEQEPASVPAGQLLEVINRKNEVAERKAANVQRAKETNDGNELVKHKLYGNGYIGYGEFAQTK